MPRKGFRTPVRSRHAGHGPFGQLPRKETAGFLAQGSRTALGKRGGRSESITPDAWDGAPWEAEGAAWKAGTVTQRRGMTRTGEHVGFERLTERG